MVSKRRLAQFDSILSKDNIIEALKELLKQETIGQIKHGFKNKPILYFRKLISTLKIKVKETSRNVKFVAFRVVQIINIEFRYRNDEDTQR